MNEKTTQTPPNAAPNAGARPGAYFLCLPVVASSCCSDGGAECCSGGGDAAENRGDARAQRPQICLPVAVGCCADTACC